MIFSINLLFTCKKESLFPKTAQAFCSGLLCIKFNENRHRTHQEPSICQFGNVCVWKPFPVIISISSSLLWDDGEGGWVLAANKSFPQCRERYLAAGIVYGWGKGWEGAPVTPKLRVPKATLLWWFSQGLGSISWLMPATLIVIIWFVAWWLCPSAVSVCGPSLTIGGFVLHPWPGGFMVYPWPGEVCTPSLTWGFHGSSLTWRGLCSIFPLQHRGHSAAGSWVQLGYWGWTQDESWSWQGLGKHMGCL